MKPEKNDLFITRAMKNVTRDQLWKAWTDPKILEQWWCPKPWTVKDVNIELRPGGASQMVMCGPNGEEMPQNGCIVYVKEKECIVFTDCMERDWRPTGSSRARSTRVSRPPCRRRWPRNTSPVGERVNGR